MFLVLLIILSLGTVEFFPLPFLYITSQVFFFVCFYREDREEETGQGSMAFWQQLISPSPKPVSWGVLFQDSSHRFGEYPLESMESRACECCELFFYLKTLGFHIVNSQYSMSANLLTTILGESFLLVFNCPSKQILVFHISPYVLVSPQILV